jgi:hypothetical protein
VAARLGAGPADVIASAHEKWLAEPSWIIDGWGSWPALAQRFDRSDAIILVDLPLARHYWWALKRQIRCVLRPDFDWPPPGCSALPVTGRLLQLMGHIRNDMRPHLPEMVDTYRERKAVVTLRSPAQMQCFLDVGPGLVLGQRTTGES